MNTASQYKLQQVNNMDNETFVKVFGSVFEDSPWAAVKAFKQAPFASIEALVDAMCGSVMNAGEEWQLELLRAHPELGSRGKMATASVSEQQGAGITAAAERQKQALETLNREYREKFSFPFIVAVKGMTPEMIIENMKKRLENDDSTEFDECLQQVLRIARLRLDGLLVED